MSAVTLWQAGALCFHLGSRSFFLMTYFWGTGSLVLINRPVNQDTSYQWIYEANAAPSKMGCWIINKIYKINRNIIIREQHRNITTTENRIAYNTIVYCVVSNKIYSMTGAMGQDNTYTEYTHKHTHSLSPTHSETRRTQLLYIRAYIWLSRTRCINPFYTSEAPLVVTIQPPVKLFA